MALTDTVIRTATAASEPYTLTDEKGLSIQIQPSGSKWWRFRYRFDSKAKMLSLGTYPDISLKDARARRDQARKLLADGVDPGAARRAAKPGRVGKRPYRLPTRTRNGEIGGQTKKRLPTLHLYQATRWSNS